MALVSEIRKEGRIVTIVWEDAPALRLQSAVFKLLPLQEGEEIDLKAFMAALTKAEYQPAQNACLKWLAQRPLSSRQLLGKLEASCFHEPAIRRVLDRLQELGLLDDSRFAQDWVQQRGRSKSLGKARLKQELAAKGIAGEEIDQALAAVSDEDALHSALALAQKLMKRYAGESETDCRRKVIASLSRRGFDYGMASKAYRQARQSLQEAGETDF